jgi:hypothetical protein
MKLATVIELDGKYWGCQYDDTGSQGGGRDMDFGPIENATLVNRKHCKETTWVVSDNAYDARNRERLAKAHFVDIEVYPEVRKVCK